MNYNVFIIYIKRSWTVNHNESQYGMYTIPQY